LQSLQRATVDCVFHHDFDDLNNKLNE